MATVAEEHRMHMRGGEGGSVAEALGGGAAIVLTILGLVGVEPQYLAAVAVIAIGVSLFLQGGTTLSWFSRLATEAGVREMNGTDIEGGMTAGFVGGITGVVLGILALLGVAASTLPAVAVIVFGAALLLESGTTARLNSIGMAGQMPLRAAQEVTREAVRAATGAEILIGVGTVVLGILALGSEAHTTVLILVALLAVGVAILMSGSALASRIAGIARH